MNQFSRTLDRWIGKRRYDEVAPLLGAAVGTVHAWRHGTTLPAASRVPTLALAMGVPEDALRKSIERSRKHCVKRGATGTTATVDEPLANGVSP